MIYIGNIMNKLYIYIIFLFVTLFSNNMYWDLGVAVLENNTSLSSEPIKLSTYHRIEGMKEYYMHHFDNAIFHFEQLSKSEQQLVLYEYLDSYYSLNKLSHVIDVLNNYNDRELSDNVIYLKSKTLAVLGQYDEALLLLNYIKNNFQNSDYSNIITFDLEKINLLKNED